MGNCVLAVLLAVAAAAASVARVDAVEDVLAYIDPRIGTGGFGFGVGGDPVGPQYPFGALRLSPDTRKGFEDLSFLHYGGYHINDTEIISFTHTHMVGPGVSDFGNIGVMPVRDLSSDTIRDHSSKFTRDTEIVEAGYYSAFLETPQVKAELTACSTHVGKHRYTSKTDGKFTILVDLSKALSKDGIINSTIVTNGTHATGWALVHGSLTGRNGQGVKVFFGFRLDTHPSLIRDYGVWNGNTIMSKQNETSGPVAGSYVTVSDKTVEVTVAISFVSIDQAWRNMKDVANTTTVSFDTCHANVISKWREMLSRADVHVNETDPYWKKQLTVFYTALYHSLMAPTTWSESDGSYLGMDNQIHKAPNGTVRYTDMSIWDIHRSQAPLLHLLYPDVAQDVSRSLVGMYKEGGDLPRWPIANVYASCMIGNHADVILVDAYVKGLTDFDVNAAYEAMRQASTNSSRQHNSRPGLEDYIKLGYVPADQHSKAVSLTLAYAYDDYAVSVMAESLNKTEDAEMFRQRSENYRNVWDHRTKYFCPRHQDGSFHCNVDPALHEWIFADSGFCEGDQAEYRYFVPHNLTGLVDLFGGAEEYVKHLEEFFEKTFNFNYTLIPNPHYWPGNEPDILEPFQFNVGKRADLTQKFSRAVMNQYYTTNPDGLPGNDDYGTLSAWYVFAALGFYPVAGTDQYVLGSAVFPSVTLAVPNGFELEITAKDASAANIYVSSAKINERKIDMVNDAFVKHDELIKSRTLSFDMTSSSPNTRIN